MSFSEKIDNTFISMTPDELSYKKIKEHYESLGLGLRVQPFNEIHCTIINYWIQTEVPKSFCERKFLIKRDTYSHRLVKRDSGTSVILLCFFNYGLKLLHKDLILKYGTGHRHKSFLQHISISYGVDNDINISKLPLPEFDISLENFSGSSGVDISTLESDLENLDWN